MLNEYEKYYALTVSRPHECKADVCQLDKDWNLRAHSEVDDGSYVQREEAVSKETHALEEGAALIIQGANLHFTTEELSIDGDYTGSHPNDDEHDFEKEGLVIGMSCRAQHTMVA